MSNSLPVPAYTTTLSSTGTADTITIDMSSWSTSTSWPSVTSINMNSPGSGYFTATGAVGSIGTITLTDSLSNVNWTVTEWENCFPDFNKVNEMCETYPGLKIAYEKFKTVYKLVKDDYDSNTKK